MELRAFPNLYDLLQGIQMIFRVHYPKSKECEETLCGKKFMKLTRDGVTFLNATLETSKVTCPRCKKTLKPFLKEVKNETK